jgi:hypothetical protein
MKMVERIRKAIIAIAIAAMIIAQAAGNSEATTLRAPAPVIAELDLDLELGVLNTFFTELAKFDNKCIEFSRRSELTAAEFESLERAGNELKRRLSVVEGSLRDVIRKLQDAGLWERLNEIVLEKTPDELLPYIEQENFNEDLEEAASGISNSADELVSALDSLRNLVRAQVGEPIFRPGHSALASRVVRVSYRSAAAPSPAPVRCRLAKIRLRIDMLFFDENSTVPKSAFAVGCYCNGDAGDCAIIGASPPR